MENLFFHKWPACHTSARPFPDYIRHLFRAASRGVWADGSGGDGRGQLLFGAVTGAVWRGSKADGYSGVAILGGWLCGRLFGVAVQNGGSSGCGGCSERQAGEWFRAQLGCPEDLSGTLDNAPAHA